jgi:hypothetical protein
MWSGVWWSDSSNEEEDDLDIRGTDCHDTPHKDPHMLLATTPRWCFFLVLLFYSLASHDSAAVKLASASFCFLIFLVLLGRKTGGSR